MEYFNPTLQSIKPQNFSPAPQNFSQNGTDTTAMLTNNTTQNPASAPVTPASPTKQPTKNTFSVNLTDAQKALIKKNNPEFFSSRPDVFATDLTTEKVDVPTSEAGTSPLDSSLQSFANTNPEQADQVMDALGYTGSPNNTQPMAMDDYVVKKLFETFDAQQNFDPTAIKEAEGVYQKREIARQSQQAYTEATVKQRRTIQEMRQNPEGKLRGALNADIENYKYESDQNLADLAMKSYFDQGKYESAVEIANDAIQAQTQKFEQGISFLSNMYTLLQNDLSDSEKMMFQSQLSQQEYAFKNLQDAKSQAMQSAGANGAPPEVLSAIKNSQTMEDVWANAGSYGIDPAMSLAQDRFAWDKMKYWNDQAIQQSIMNETSTAQEALEIQTRNEALATAGKSLEDIKSLESNIQGLKEATGTTWIGRTGLVSPISANRTKFIAEAKYLLSNKTFEKLADITQNTSLGAISEGELSLVREASTKLGSYLVDPEDIDKGFNGSHEQVLSAIVELRQAQEAYIEKIKRGAVSNDEYLEIQKM